ncbi:hypothetical protein SAG0136_00580 [Streptococcus agalactiae LMG 14747]|uniref:Uncharacterized protein n=1 Tax=Streptococcus agalactiae LMG 14747 TaxID=1154860 RepID=V6YYK1_STRAG|nr:hypothetical protein SAG0136_00580 [Streptococcus agalactiae LMG 14747]
MEKQTKEVLLLSAERLLELGDELTDIMNVIEMNNVALEGLEISQRVDNTTFLWLTKKYIDTAYQQNEKLYKRLDEIAFLLLNNDNARELEVFNQ